MFTNTQIEEIRKKLQLVGVKDSSLPTANPLNGTESVAVVQQGQNKQVKFKDFVLSIADWNVNDIINVSKDGTSMYLVDAINKVSTTNRKEGQIITFLNKVTGTWSMYQFRGEVTQWANIDWWYNILDTADYHFRGYLFNEAVLKSTYPRPQIGDFAFVGNDLKEAVTYACIQNGEWYNTKRSSLIYADAFEAVYSEDVEEIEPNAEDIIADRAIKDSLGRVIVDTYITREDLNNIIERIIALEKK